MSGDRVRVGVWGLGPHAINKLLPALAASSRCELVGVTTRDHAVLVDAAARFGCRAWSTADEMLADAVDAIYITTPIGLHDGQAQRVLEARKHVWCEKSLTHDPARSLSLVAAGRLADRAVCEAFMYIHHPQFARLREVIARPSFGATVSMTIRFGMPHLTVPGFRYDPELGGGALLDVGCYPLHLASQLLGPVSVERARLEHRGYAVDVEGWAELASSSGSRALLEWGYGLAYRNEALVWGRGGSVSVEKVFSKRPTDETVLAVANVTGTPSMEHVAPANAFVAMFEALAATVTDREQRERWWILAEVQAQLMAAVLHVASAAPSPRPSRG